MKNRSAAQRAIPYCPEYKLAFEPFLPLLGEKTSRPLSVLGSILIRQLDYWFNQKPNGFYKFMSPPGKHHSAYKEGDSWTEELQYSRREFETAFKQIGISYKTKKALREASKQGDPFQGRFYLSYYDRVKRLTFYYRNHTLVDRFLDKVATLSNEEMTESQQTSRNNDPWFLGNNDSSNLELTNRTFHSTETTNRDYSQEKSSAAAQQLYKETAGLPQVKAIPEESAHHVNEHLNSFSQCGQDLPPAQDDWLANPNGQTSKPPLRIDTVPRSSKKQSKRGARPNDLAYDKHGWLQLPSARTHKLPRWLACRWMQITLAVDYLDFEVLGIAPDDQPVLQAKDGLMTASYAFGDRDNAGEYPLRQLRDCATVDRGQSQALSQDWYNETLQGYFERCNQWCKEVGSGAMAIINEQTVLRMVGFWEPDYEDSFYSWDELEDRYYRSAA